MQLVAHCLSSGHVDTHREDFEEDRHVWIGLLYICLGFVCTTGNFIMLYAIMCHPLIVHSCFKLLAIVSIYDLLNLILLTFVSGTMSLLDVNHCNSGIWITKVGYVMSFTWCGYSAAAELLAFNRLLEFWNKPLCNKMFRGDRCWLWTPLPMCYFMALYYFKQPSFYYYDPFAGGWVFYVEDHGNANYMLLINNFLKFGFLLVIYTATMIYMYKQSREHPERANKLERSVALQSLSVAVITGLMTIVYLCVQFLPPTSMKYTPLIGHLSWIVANASTSFVYLMVNRSVRRNVGRIMGMAVEVQVQQLRGSSGSNWI